RAYGPNIDCRTETCAVMPAFNELSRISPEVIDQFLDRYQFWYRVSLKTELIWNTFELRILYWANTYAKSLLQTVAAAAHGKVDHFPAMRSSKTSSGPGVVRMT